MMNALRRKTLYEEIYNDIDKNELLLSLYNELLRNYTRLIFGRKITLFNDKDLESLLGFAEILANSKEGSHKVWAQQIVALLLKLEPANEAIKEAKDYVLTRCTNYQGLNNALAATGDFLDDLSNLLVMEEHKVPNTTNDHFFHEQKLIYEGFEKDNFSYSAPTSLGKTYVIMVFIKEQIKKGFNKNFALLVPTKALISEVKAKIEEEMMNDIVSHNYRLITNVGDLALSLSHNFVFIMTPERLLYLVNNKEDLKLDYVFVDEAHKLSSNDTRSPIYYDLLDKISRMHEIPHIFFSSPNIPNPEIYLKLLRNGNLNNKIHVTFSPVSQIKYLVELDQSGSVSVYNDYSKTFIKMGNDSKRINLNYIIDEVGKNCQNIIYCSSIDKTMNLAFSYAKLLPYKNNNKLEVLSKEIATKINKDYLLVDIIKKGVAFHVGYLPSSIRAEIEDLYKKGIINTLFCTSTLIEGVNLPADNLFVTDIKAGKSRFDEVSFRNLIGRVGRIKYNLFGNVFLVKMPQTDEKIVSQYKELVTTDIPTQELSIDANLGNSGKRIVVESLKNEDYELKNRSSHTTNNQFEIMRKFQLILKNDIQNDNNSAVLESFKENLTCDIKDKIKASATPDNKSIDISPDQYKSLKEYIEAGGQYPTSHFDYNKIVEFLKTLANIFKWRVYEKSTLGNIDKRNHELTHIEYYAVILRHWMKGDNLAYIINSTIEYKEDHPDSGVWLNSWKVHPYYNRYDIRHKNYVIADTLNALDRVILFKILNYFREFSTEYKKFHQLGDKRFPNDWYEYVEYGTSNDVIIVLQQSGFEREQASYIKSNGFIDYSTSCSVADFTIIKEKVLNAKDKDVIKQAKEVMLNLPELFK